MIDRLLARLGRQGPAAPPPEAGLSLRAHPPRPRRLSRRVLMGAAASLGLVVAFALLQGLSDRPRRAGPHQADGALATTDNLPEGLRTLPARYDRQDLKPETPPLQPPIDRLWGTRGPPETWEDAGADALDESELQPPEDPLWRSPPTAPPAERQAARAPVADPAVSPIFFEPRRQTATPMALQSSRSVDAPIEGGERREGFLARQRNSADVLDSPYLPPRSPYELHAGAVIPAALVTALNSDLPGRVIAQVTAPVYDSVSGDHLLIPQGARLIGTYDSANVYGDNRVFLVWNRIIMPNGWSLQLAGMEATDPTGAAGLSDRTDNHLDRLAGAIGLSAVLSILANEAEDTNRNDSSLTQSVGDAAAQEAARVGGRIIDRQLNVRPTLRVRPGAPVRVLVTRDIQLRPYRE